MSRSPKLKRADAGHEDVEHERSRPNDRGRQSPQGHHRDVTRRPGMTHGRIEKRDHADGEKKQNEMRVIHHVGQAFVMSSDVPVRRGPGHWANEELRMTNDERNLK